MKVLVGLAVFFLLAACCSAQDENAVAEWHLRAPERGCVEVSHRVGGSVFRVYACDGVVGPCIFAQHVVTCPTSALFQKPNFERVVNVRSRDHLVRYYNQIGGARVLSLLPECCYSYDEVVAQDEDNCKCMDLPTGERICDPYRCEKEGGAESDMKLKALRDLIKKVMMQAE